MHERDPEKHKNTPAGLSETTHGHEHKTYPRLTQNHIGHVEQGITSCNPSQSTNTSNNINQIPVPDPYDDRKLPDNPRHFQYMLPYIELPP
jgi:hypothetical protein